MKRFKMGDEVMPDDLALQPAEALVRKNAASRCSREAWANLFQGQTARQSSQP